MGPGIQQSSSASDDDLDAEPADPQCPVCEKDNETLKAIRRVQVETAEKHELFLDALSRSRDRLGTVSEFFGRGVMGAESSPDV